MDLPIGTTDLVAVAGHRVNVWSAGDTGPPVLLVHGIPTNHRLWADVVPVVSRRARVLAVDMLGYGDSPAPGDQPVDLASQASAAASRRSSPSPRATGLPAWGSSTASATTDRRCPWCVR